MSEIGLVDKFEMIHEKSPTITLVVKRNVVDNLLLRNSSEGRAEIERLSADDGEKILAKANGEKFVSKERLTGLNLLRELTSKEEEITEWSEENRKGLISKNYLYNEAIGLLDSLNMDTLTYGNAGTGNDNFSFKSNVVEGYTYSTREYDVTGKETRNGIRETGTMHDEDMNQSQSLYDLNHVKPGNSFIHFISLWSGTKSNLLYTIHNILNTTEYGARETRTGKNVENEIIGMIQSPNKFSLSTREFLEKHHSNDKNLEENIRSYIEENKKHNWKIHMKNYPDWFQNIVKTASRKEDKDKELYKQFEETTQQAFEKIIEQ